MGLTLLSGYQTRGSVWRCPKKLDQGDFARMRRSAVLMLKTIGSRRGLTSSQSSGIDTGARGRQRTENGGTMVWPGALRMMSRYTGARRFALRDSMVTSLGFSSAISPAIATA